MKNFDKETSKRIILSNVSEIDKLVTRSKDVEEAYHHANFILTQVIFVLLGPIHTSAL